MQLKDEKITALREQVKKLEDDKLELTELIGARDDNWTKFNCMEVDK